VIQAAVVWHIQPLDLDIKSLIIYAQTSPDGKACTDQVPIIDELVAIAFHHHASLSVIAADGDNGYNPLHDSRFESHCKIYFWRFEPLYKQRRRIMCDPLHLLKWSRPSAQRHRNDLGLPSIVASPGFVCIEE
jgi:hypothetical protein